MRIPLTGIEITTRRALDARIAATAKAEAEARAGELARRYAHNTDCLRAAVAAHFGLTDTHFIAPNSMTLKPMSRAIEAFATAMMKARGET